MFIAVVKVIMTQCITTRAVEALIFKHINWHVINAPRPVEKESKG